MVDRVNIINNERWCRGCREIFKDYNEDLIVRIDLVLSDVDVYGCILSSKDYWSEVFFKKVEIPKLKNYIKSLNKGSIKLIFENSWRHFGYIDQEKLKQTAFKDLFDVEEESKKD